MLHLEKYYLIKIAKTLAKPNTSNEEFIRELNSMFFDQALSYDDPKHPFARITPHMFAEKLKTVLVDTRAPTHNGSSSLNNSNLIS